MLGVDAARIVVGNDPSQGLNVGWMDGACYLPIEDVRVGDVLEFDYQGHNVYKMKDRRAYQRCDFREAELLGSMDHSPYFYRVEPGDDSLFFACKVGSHCQGMQRLWVRLNPNELEPRTEDPVSTFALGASSSACDLVQRGDADPGLLQRAMESSCSDPVLLAKTDDRHWLFTSCLSPPMTLTPGGVINQATVLHYPYPTDRRVVMGTRIWEFVQNQELTPVHVNQLYVHHILGDVVMGNGAESIRRSDEDAAFPPPYGRLTGDFNDVMTFHLIDLRGVDQWLECVECRCKDVNGTFLDVGGGAGEGEASNDDLAGGIGCCSNCTDLTTPTVDYRLRYNVTYMEIPQDDYVEPIIMLSADIAPAIDKSIEFDVPLYTDLPNRQQLDGDPTVQVLSITGKLREIFRHGFFADTYHGPDDVTIHRCTGHMHIGALEQWLEDATTGEILCHNQAVYGTNPAEDKGFLTSLSVKNYQEDGPMILSADTRLRLVTHYNASVVHTGVMGMFFLFVSESTNARVRADVASLTVDVCASHACNASQLPREEDIPVCKDDLGFFCRFLQICDCETFLALDEVKGGCGGVLMSSRGNFSVDRFCAETCGCKHLEREGAREEILTEGIEDRIASEARDLCHYSTEGCHDYLSNMYACAAEQPGSEDLDDFVRTILVDKGRRMALEHAKLGDRAIHRFDAAIVKMDPYDVPNCPLESSAMGGYGCWIHHLLVGFMAIGTTLLMM